MCQDDPRAAGATGAKSTFGTEQVKLRELRGEKDGWRALFRLLLTQTFTTTAKLAAKYNLDRIKVPQKRKGCSLMHQAVQSQSLSTQTDQQHFTNRLI